MIQTNITSSGVNRFTPSINYLINDAPEQGSGLHHWLMRGAILTQDMPEERAFDMIAQTVVARGGRVIERSIRQALAKARSGNYVAGESQPKWPEPETETIEQLTLVHMWDVPGALRTLERSSPDSLKRRTPNEIAQRLFGPDAYIAVGFVPEDTFVWKTSTPNLDKLSFLTPNPMRGRV
jgi:hypothetical protein